MAPLRRNGSRNVATAQAHPKAQAPTDLVATRDGFPWPAQTVLFHATAALDRIRAQGFRTRKQGATEALGGRHTNSTSLTLSEGRAGSIAIGLDALVRGARRELTLVQLAQKLERECPKALRQALWGGGFPLQDAVEDRDDPMSSLLPLFRKLDAGWRTFYPYSMPDTAPAPRSIRVSDRHWLLPPDAPTPPEGSHKATVPTGSTSAGPDLFFELYRSTVRSGSYTGECFNPIWTGTDMAGLARLLPQSVGVIRAKVHIPRVCSEAEGLLRLGYLDEAALSDRRLRRSPFAYREGLDTWGRGCQARLSRGADLPDDDYDNALLKKQVRKLLAGDPWYVAEDQVLPGGWATRQQGRVSRTDTMLYYNGEEELRVYAPSQIEVLGAWSMAELRRRHRLGDRVTWPAFDPGAEDIRVWPPRRQR